MNKIKEILGSFFKINLSLLIIFYLLRIFEYFTACTKLNISANAFSLELHSLFFDTFTWFVYCAIVLLPFVLASILNQKGGRIFLLIINGILIFACFALTIIFSERLVPFDHEVLVRPLKETIFTGGSVLSGKLILGVYLLAFIAGYYAIYHLIAKRLRLKVSVVYLILFFVVASFFLKNYSSPQRKSYTKLDEYHFVVNKLNYFISDCYTFLYVKEQIDVNNSNKDNTEAQIKEYHENNKRFKFLDNEYPMMHFDDTKNVLKDFFNIGDTVPNIVIIIYESLSSDFSGRNAPSGSFTPFLDSLADHSLTWYNCLSSASATFNSAPSITGSLPYGDKGFALFTEPPTHVTLLKILKKNNWNAYYFTGADINFDNFGGFFRLQGVDYVSETFPSKYKKMGAGPDGWSEGYPDDALYNYSMEVLDSINYQPYISVYLTLSTHTPFIFEQRPLYDKKFEQLMEARKLPQDQRRYLRKYAPMFSCFLFSDDCMKDFFAKYKKRKDYRNTIFVMVGDHHHGFFPSRNDIDEYNVPLIIYSPLLKKGVKFESVNSHLNIAPTLLSLLKNSYHLKYFPRYAPWMGEELDTCRTFRNIHHIPFMFTNRDIDDYIYEDYYIAGKVLYKIKPGLNLDYIEDKQLTEKIIKIRENFKFVNAYVCQKNKLFSASENIYDSHFEELYTYEDKDEKFLTTNEPEFTKIDNFKPPLVYKKIMVKMSFEVKYDTTVFEKLPQVATSIYSHDNEKQLLWSYKEIKFFVDSKHKKDGWAKFVDEDIFSFDNFPDKEGHFVHVEVCNWEKIKIKIKNLKVTFLGVK